MQYGLCDLRVRVKVRGYTVRLSCLTAFFFFVLYSYTLFFSLRLLYPCFVRYGDAESDRRESWR